MLRALYVVEAMMKERNKEYLQQEGIVPGPGTVVGAVVGFAVGALISGNIIRLRCVYEDKFELR